jgi:formimidoylglutamate deiminase
MDNAVFAECALLTDGWAKDVLIEIDSFGDITSVTTHTTPGSARRAGGPVIPGMPNVHSHAFQRAMAGLSEQTGRNGANDRFDSFWTWRTVMYEFLSKLGPDAVETIAAQVYVEMLKAGYTAVAEFHYLHHDPSGRPYNDVAEMSERLVAAAQAACIGLTLLPVLYGTGGFGGIPAREGQRRFLNDPDRLLRLVEELQRRHPEVRVGIAPHSLRAVTPEMLCAAVAGITALDPSAPIHLHIAEQIKEVEDCVAWSGLRPVAWLFAHQPVDQRWCLVHATHVGVEETGTLAQSGAVVALCPTTEANLGDGLFPAIEYLAAGGEFGIGSDSHVSVSPVEELRWLEYGQRLATRRRNCLAVGPLATRHTGASLYLGALSGGRRATGRRVGRIAKGERADLLVLDCEAATLLGRDGDGLLDSLVFVGNQSPIRHVMVGGRFVIENGRHRAEDSIRQRYAVALRHLTS